MVLFNTPKVMNTRKDKNHYRKRGRILYGTLEQKEQDWQNGWTLMKSEISLTAKYQC